MTVINWPKGVIIIYIHFCDILTNLQGVRQIDTKSYAKKEHKDLKPINIHVMLVHKD